MTFSYEAHVGGIAWMDLSVPTIEQLHDLADFYEKVFGWQFSSPRPDVDDYMIATLNGKSVLGIALIPDKPSVWVPYFRTDDIHAALERAAKRGGATQWGPQTNGVSHMALALDPTGAVYGLWQPAPATGIEVMNESGSIVWSNLTTSDVNRSANFYTQVTGALAEPMEFGGYTLGTDEGTFASVMPYREDVEEDRRGKNHDGDYWAFFIQVNSTTETLATVSALGGEVVGGPEETPFGIITSIVDPVAKTRVMLLESQQAQGDKND